MVVRRARLVPRIVLPWRVVICALGHDVSCSLALANPVWGDGHYRPSCAPRPRLPSAHRSPSHGPGPPCPPPNPVGRGRILLLEILQITLSAEPFLAAVGVPRGGWCRADHEHYGLVVVCEWYRARAWLPVGNSTPRDSPEGYPAPLCPRPLDPGRRARRQTRSAADEFYCLKSFKLLCPRSLSWPLSGYPSADGAGLTMNTADWWSCASDIVCGLDLRAKDRVSVRSPGPATAHAISLTNTLDLFSPDVY